MKELLLEKWPLIVEAFSIALAYFFVFLYRHKVSQTKTFLLTAFKEKTQKVEKSYEETDVKYKELLKRIKELEKVYNILVEHYTEEEVENGPKR